MRIYCLCEGSDNNVLEGQQMGSGHPPVVLQHSMPVLAIGVEQRLVDGRVHYPNVDIRECKACGRKIALE